MVKDYFKNKLFNLSKALSSTHPKIALRDWEYKPDPKNNVVHFSHRVHGVITVKPNTKESSKSDYPLIAVHNGASIGRFKTAGEAALGVAKYASSLGKKSFTRLYNIDPMKIKTKKSEYSEKNVLSHFSKITKNVPTMKQMLGPTLTPEHKEHIEWAKKLPNSNWQIWATKQYKNNPAAFTPQIKQKIEHFAGSQHIPEISKVRFGKEHDLESGLNLLESAEKQYNERIKDNLNLVKPTARTKKLVQGKTKPNRHWYDVGVGSCSAEGKAMGHCGNAPSKVAGDRILSLRTEHKDTKGNVYHEPHLTFVLNNGFLGEMKGRGNEKPTAEYHKDIAELLKDKRIRGVLGGGYASDKNFDFSDLSPELQQEVRQANPDLITLDENGIDKILSGEVKFPKKHQNIKIDLASNPDLHPKYHAKLVNDSDRYVRKAIAENPKLHPDHYATLANDPEKYVRAAIASNPNLHPDHHAKLVSDPVKYVRQAIASNPNLHPDYHATLVNDKDIYVRAAIAINPNLHPDHHAKLVNDPNEHVRRAIASNPNLHPDHQAKLVNDPNEHVRRAIASNPNLHPDLQAKLVDDPNEYVRWAIASNPSYIAAQKQVNKSEQIRKPDLVKKKATIHLDNINDRYPSDLRNYFRKKLYANNKPKAKQPISKEETKPLGQPATPGINPRAAAQIQAGVNWSPSQIIDHYKRNLMAGLGINKAEFFRALYQLRKDDQTYNPKLVRPNQRARVKAYLEAEKKKGGLGKINISTTNSKLNKDRVASFNLPAIETCPGAGDCANFCFADTGSILRFHNKTLPPRVQNWLAALRSDFVEKMAEKINEYHKKGMRALRIHDSGDFFSPQYIDKWIEIAKKLPHVPLYAYTKSHHPKLRERLNELEKLPNVNIVQSFGSKYDHLIDTNKPHAVIFPDKDTMLRAGYADAMETDLTAADKNNKKVGLYIHGTDRSKYKGLEDHLKGHPQLLADIMAKLKNRP